MYSQKSSKTAVVEIDYTGYTVEVENGVEVYLEFDSSHSRGNTFKL